MNKQKVVIGSRWTVEHWRKDVLLATRVDHNVCPDEFINHMLDVVLGGVTPVDPWYIGLIDDDTAPVAGDTYASPGFSETTGYDETTRQEYIPAAAASKVITNTDNKAAFTMTGTPSTIYGAALFSYAGKNDQAQSGAVLGPAVLFTGGAITGIADNDIIRIYIEVTGSNQ